VPITENATLTRLQSKQLALGVVVKLHAGVEMAKIARACDHDFLFIDMQHGGMSVESTVALCHAALDTGVTPLVRVARSDTSLATRLLDNGALGIIVPDIETAEQAREVVANCRFPPRGRRSVGAGYPQLGYEALSTSDAMGALDRQTLLVAMIESRRGIDNVEAIAQVPGIDVLHIGSNDLLAEMGISDQLGKEPHFALCRRVQEACRAHDKVFGIGGVRDPGLQRRFIAMGALMMTTNSDLAFLMAGLAERARVLRAAEQ
jgi:2-keto-3-deoxy-L-rhamnonate aldolase RhmA